MTKPSTPASRAANLARQKAWQAANPARAREIRAKADRKRTIACPGRSTAAAKAWRLAHPERWLEIQRRSRLKMDHGLTLEELQQMHANQEGLCAICSKFIDLFPRGVRRRMMQAHVDHDHVTGEIRGLLCPQCNMAIGLAYDSPTVLRNAAGYLEGA